MTWDYRIIQNKIGEVKYYSIHEVYYNETGDIDCWTENPISAYGDSVYELCKDLEQMYQAVKKPILNLEDMKKIGG